MALIVMILRKMAKNKWLEMSLLLGLVFSVGLISSIPIYSDGILKKMLVKELEQSQEHGGKYPGNLYFSTYLNESKSTPAALAGNLEHYLRDVAGNNAGIPLREMNNELSTRKVKWNPVSKQVDATIDRYGYLEALDGLEKHVKLIDGRMPGREPVNGVYEALVEENALVKLHMVINQEFQAKDDRTNQTITIKPVGVFKPDASDPLYWYFNPYTHDALYINYDLFKRDILSTKVFPADFATWNLSFDYTKLKIDHLQQFVNTYNAARNYFIRRVNLYSIQTEAYALPSLNTYTGKAKQLTQMMWSLNTPVVIMLAFYLYMVSNLIIDRQKTEISVLRSRGASRTQIVLSYVAEMLILSAVALAAGLVLGLGFTKMLGSTNGFLEFVQRRSLETRISAGAVKYGLITLGCALVMTLIPAVSAARKSIVSQKQQLARKTGMSFWHKFGLDVVLLGVSIYGLTTFKRRMQVVLDTNIDAQKFQIDPLLFLIPALFMIGFTLLVLRIYPWLLRFIYWVGRKLWSPSAYSTLIQVGRSGTQYQFLMIFLALTIATGLFSASAARTLNLNSEDQVRYANGADMVLTSFWENDAPPPGGGAPPGMGPGGGGDSSPGASKVVHYVEPPFKPFTELPEVAHAAKVFKKTVDYGDKNGSGKAQLMGIDTDDFGYTAWFRNSLNPYPLYEYLNLIAPDPFSVLISRTMAKEDKLKPGDTISVGWDGSGSYQTFTVYGIVDYFPGFNPQGDNPDGRPGGPKPMLIVGHLDAIQNTLGLQPYDVWLKLKPGADRQKLFDALSGDTFRITNLVDTTEQVAQAKRDPFRLGINGMMTLGFLIAMIVSFCGFLIYWVLSLQGRILQFGVLRAMGISFGQLVLMLVGEQLLTSGAAIAIGAGTGRFSSSLFVPLFGLTFQADKQVPPFHIIVDPNDILNLFGTVTAMVLLGLGFLSYMLSRIKIHQAVKLGED